MTAFLPLGFLAFFAGLWAGVSYLLSRLSGWRTLAERYPGAEEPKGERLLWTSGQLGAVSFNSCLNMTFSSAGFHLVPSLMFRLFMPPLLIPWSGVRFEGFSQLLFLEFAHLRLGGADGAALRVFRRTAKRFRPYLSERDGREYDSDRRFEGSRIDRPIVIVLLAAAAAGLLAALIAARR
jgi:hypothetical protein